MTTQASRDAAGELWRDFGFDDPEPNEGQAAALLETMALALERRAEAVREECARVVEALPPFQQMPDRVIPAHTAYDDLGCEIGPVPESVEKRKRLTSLKDAAAAIRNLKGPSE